ncbi:maestro heat-like repeat-containing protein family member 1 [Pseudophryne corroboree]|uniref:maestro heat-like repeat-containing protein family member 1 n=1 Tax=Pseudophryne corroboree TaxID=495146 RepID=UPI0030819264
MASSSVKRLAVTLMDASTDKDHDVQEQIYNSLCFMGETAPAEILESCASYLRQHDKLSYVHRTIILRAMETVVRNNLTSLSKETAKMVIVLASNEMTKSKDVIFEWQQAASSILVAVGRGFINCVMEEILLKFQPGILPHFFIMQTLANLAVANVFGMVPFLNSVLGTMLPMFPIVKQDPMKAVFCVALQHFSESIQEYLANLDKAPDPSVRKDTFSSDMFSAYDVLFYGWLQNRESKVWNPGDPWLSPWLGTLSPVPYFSAILLLHAGFAPDHTDELVEKLQTFRQGLHNPDSSALFHTCFNIAMIIGKLLPPEQLTSLIFVTFEGLSDPDPNCSRAATVMINSLLKDRGTILLLKVPEIIERVHEQLQETPEEHIKKAAVQTIYILATQHMAAVVTSLLCSPVPYDSETCTLWKALSSDPPLTSQVLTLLLEKMTGDVPYKESKASLLSSMSGRVATLLPLTATCALREVLCQPESAPTVQELYSLLFVSLLLRVSSMVGVQLPKNLCTTTVRKSSSPPTTSRSLDPCSSAIEALQFMLNQGGCEEVTLSVETDGGWENMKKEETHYLGVTSLSRSMVRYAGPKLPIIIKSLQSALSSVYDSQRITATAFLAQLLQSSDLSDLIFLEPLMDNMTSRLKDSSVIVRMLAVRGLGNIAAGYPDKVRKNGSQLLTSMINAMDDREDPDHIVTQEAMSSLSRLLPHMEDKDMRSLLIHTAIRIRPFFDHEKEELRKASIMLFGNLTRLNSEWSEEVLFEQILNGLVTLLLHLQDPKPGVVKACKFALQMCAPNIKNQSLADMFLSHLHPDRGLHYGEFMNNVCKHLLQGYPDMISRLVQTNISYFKSTWPDIRAAAPMFIGFLVLNMQKEQCNLVDLDHLVTSLVILLKDPVPAVRIKASEAMGLLVKFV